jgi:hypothetical protein
VNANVSMADMSMFACTHRPQSENQPILPAKNSLVPALPYDLLFSISSSYVSPVPIATLTDSHSLQFPARHRTSSYLSRRESHIDQLPWDEDACPHRTNAHCNRRGGRSAAFFQEQTETKRELTMVQVQEPVVDLLSNNLFQKK